MRRPPSKIEMIGVITVFIVVMTLLGALLRKATTAFGSGSLLLVFTCCLAIAVCQESRIGWPTFVQARRALGWLRGQKHQK